MGAEQFTHVAAGKDTADAFHAAVDEATYDHGHSGYTGTIAEKGGYIVFSVPPDVSPFDVEEALSRDDSEWLIDNKIAKVERLLSVYDDKWGPAVALEVPAAFAKGVRVSSDPDHHTDLKVFLFCGWASS